MKLQYVSFLIAVTILSINACEKDDPDPVNPEEIITTLTYSLTPVNGGTTITFQFKDLDGDGGNAPIITNGNLEANTTYEGFIALLNESVTPAEDITKEVDTEAEEHQLFYVPQNGLDASISYADEDANANPLGLATMLTTGDASQGQLQIILRHEPDKTASGVATGDPTNAGGETDIEVTFEVSIQ